MLAGLIFAIEEAEDRPGTLAATLPFGGMTLLEYQVRLLVGAGVEQVLVAVGQMPPALIAAVTRAGKRHAQVEVVRSAEEASEKVAPDACVIVIADGLVTSEPVIERMAQGEGGALLVTADADSTSAIERLDMRDSWAGIARVNGAELAEIAGMPADYDFQSALLRVAVQAGAEHVMLTPGWERGGHLVERNAASLASRSGAVLAALTERRRGWADRWVFTRIARLVLPELVRRGVGTWLLVALGALTSFGALFAIAWRWPGVGCAIAVFAAAMLATAAAMAALNGESGRADRIELGVTALFGAVVLLAGATQAQMLGDWTPLVLALGLAGDQALVERASARHRRWWASPAAHLLLLAPFALAGWLEAGLAVLGTYAFATLASAVETMRAPPPAG